LEDRLGDLAYGDQIGALRDALIHWALFDAPSRAYRNDGAHLTESASVPARHGTHRGRTAAYLDARMFEPFADFL